MNKYNLGLIFLLIFSLFWGCGKSEYLYYEKAEEYADSGYYIVAIEEYKKAIKEFPENITFRKNLASLYYQTEDYENCISELKKVLDIEPDNSQVIKDIRNVQVKMAESYEEQYKLDKAVEVYEELLKDEPENTVILQKLINLNRKLRDESKLIAYLKRVPSSDSDMYSAALSQIVTIEIKNEEYQKAIENIQKLIELNPDNIYLRYVLVSLYKKIEKYELAIEQLLVIKSNLPESQRTEIYKEIKEGYLSQAARFEMKGELESAVKAYQEVFKLEPDNILHHKLGNLYYQMRQYSKAKKQFQKASDSYGINNAAYLHYVYPPEDISQEVEITDFESLREFKEFLRECAEKYSVPLSLVVALIKAESSLSPDCGISRTGNVGLMQLGTAAAIDLGLRVDGILDERYIPRKNIIAGVRYLRMMLDRYDGVITEALSAYNAGPGRVKSGTIPNFNETRWHISKVIHQKERYEKYPAELERDMNILAANVVEYQGKQNGILVDCRVKEAIDMLEKAKGNPIAMFNLALLYDQIGKNSQASELYQQLLQEPFVSDSSLKQIVSSIHLNLAYNKFIDGEYESAYILLKDAKIDIPQYHYQMGLILAFLGKFESSLEYLNSQLYTNRVSVYNTLGYIFLKTEDISSARENFEKALEIEPENSFALQGIVISELIKDIPDSVEKKRLLSGIVYNINE